MLDYKGKMFKVDTRSIDMLVTPDHRLYMKYGSKNSDHGNFNVVKAREVNSNSPRVSFMSAGIGILVYLVLGMMLQKSEIKGEPD